MSAIRRILFGLIEREGGFVDHPDDPGGATRWGITERVARQEGYLGPMAEFPRDLAYGIYERRYWRDTGFHLLAEHSMAIAAELLDSGVNLGPHWPATWLQRWLNAFNRRQKDYPDLKVDGKVGFRTAGALGAYLGRRSEAVLLRALNCSQGVYYLDLVENPARGGRDESFIYGWLARRVG